MAKKKKEDSSIALELANFERKIAQYQAYLDKYDVTEMFEDKKRHDEIVCQIKIMDSLPGWLTALEKLLMEEDEATKKIEIRGEGEMSGLMEQKKKI